MQSPNSKGSLTGIMRETPILPLLVISFTLAVLFVPHFCTVYNLKNYLLQSSDLLIISCGLTFVVLNGGIDFSVTSVMALASVICAYIMVYSPLAATPALSIPVAILATLGTGVFVGIVNGLSLTRFKVPSFIATLATQLVITGIAIFFTSLISETSSIFGLPEAFFILGGEGNFFFVPILIAIAIWCFSHWLLNKTIFGRRVYAIGVNPQTSFISGLPVKQTLMWLMILSAVFAAIAGIIATARNQVGMSSMGDKMFITVIASVIVGGTSTAGGFGGVHKTLMGVLFIALINNSLNLLGVGWYTIMIVLGLLIALSAMTTYLFNHKSSSD